MTCLPLRDIDIVHNLVHCFWGNDAKKKKNACKTRLYSLASFGHQYLYMVVNCSELKLRVSCTLCFTTQGFVPVCCFQFFLVRLFAWDFLEARRWDFTVSFSTN